MLHLKQIGSQNWSHQPELPAKPYARPSQNVSKTERLRLRLQMPLFGALAICHSKSAACVLLSDLLLRMPLLARSNTRRTKRRSAIVPVSGIFARPIEGSVDHFIVATKVIRAIGSMSACMSELLPKHSAIFSCSNRYSRSITLLPRAETRRAATQLAAIAQADALDNTAIRPLATPTARSAVCVTPTCASPSHSRGTEYGYKALVRSLPRNMHVPGKKNIAMCSTMGLLQCLQVIRRLEGK